MLIDRFVPQGDFAERHEIGIDAPPEAAWDAVRNVDLGADAVVRWLMRLRGMRPAKTMTLSDVSRLGFVLLGEEPGVEIVVGVVGRFWRPSGNVVSVEAEKFTRFDDPGFAKAAWNFRVIRGARKTIVVTHTRVVCTDDDARRRFGRYWRLIRPFSGVIRRRALYRIKADAERATMTPPS